MLVMAPSRNRINELLSARGKSIYWLHKAIKMSYQATHGLVKSPQIPPGTAYSTLKKVAGALEVGIEELEANGDETKAE